MLSISFLKQSLFEHWKEACRKWLFTLLGTLLPVIGGVILLRLFGQWQGFSIFFVHGEFAIYSAAILTGSFFIFMQDAKENGILLLINLVTLIVSVLFYAGVQSRTIAMGNIEMGNISIDKEFLKNVTLLIFILSVILSYLGNLFENIKSHIDIQSINANAFGKLRDDFNELGGN